ncbi:MAG: VCBS repeat-containing protein [Ilumatobacter sp.]|uniref:FG-GAP repeat domain-containing protein n=1 Tax=Ilumatobacter sp. TaxID=1967498 RepID=UPI003C76B9E3
MKRFVPLVLAGVLVAACGDSTGSSGQAPAGVAGTDSEQVAPDTDPVETAVDGDADPATTESIEPAPTDPPATEPAALDPAATTPPATESLPSDPPPSDPPVTDPPAPAVPTDRIVRFFAGDGSSGSPWAPLGHWDGTAWQDLRFTEFGEFEPLPPSPITSVAVTTLDLADGLDAVISGLTLGVEAEFCVGAELGPTIELPAPLPVTSASTGYNAVAVTADWPLQPREVRQAGIEVPEYADIGAALLADEVGTAGDGSVIQAVRVDLDGNGVDEVLVTYERQEAGSFGGEGDFSSVYVRFPSSDGTVVDEQVVSYVSMEPLDFPTPGRYTLAAVADLNGDGVMEVMIRNLFWEAGGMEVFALVDGRLARVAGGGCGV